MEGSKGLGAKGSKRGKRGVLNEVFAVNYHPLKRVACR